MTLQHTLQLLGGALLVIFGIVSLFTGWVASDVAVSFVITGLSTFGLTIQTAQISAKMGA